MHELKLISKVEEEDRVIGCIDDLWPHEKQELIKSLYNKKDEDYSDLWEFRECLESFYGLCLTERTIRTYLSDVPQLEAHYRPRRPETYVAWRVARIADALNITVSEFLKAFEKPLNLDTTVERLSWSPVKVLHILVKVLIELAREVKLCASSN